MPSSHGIIPKYACFDFQLSKTVLENITNADDPHESIAVLEFVVEGTTDAAELKTRALASFGLAEARQE